MIMQVFMTATEAFIDERSIDLTTFSNGKNNCENYLSPKKLAAQCKVKKNVCVQTPSLEVKSSLTVWTFLCKVLEWKQKVTEAEKSQRPHAGFKSYKLNRRKLLSPLQVDIIIL